MESIHTDNIKSLIKFPIPIGIGTTATCFMGKDGSVIKIYRDNFYSYNLIRDPELAKKLEDISSISNETFIGPKKLIYENDKLRGYSYEYIKARDLDKLGSSTKISTLFKNFNIVLENVEKVSNKNFLLQDVHGRNILFNGNYYVIDLDRGYFTDMFKNNDLLTYNKRNVFSTIADQIYGFKPWHEGTFYGVDVNKYIYSDDINMKLIEKLCDEFRNFCNEDDPTFRKIRKKTLDRKFINTYYEGYEE